MVKLFEQDIRTNDRQSSKGNQLKWRNGDMWYKADYTGYEGLSEYVISHLLELSTLDENEFILYEPEQIKYRNQVYNGVSSKHFLKEGDQLITLERLFKSRMGISLYETVWKINDVSDRFEFICTQVSRMTGLKNFDQYMNKLFTIDALFLNEDRHMHNVAVVYNDKQEFEYCKIFDNGAGLLSDTLMDYPIGADIYELIKDCRAKTISSDFDEQLDVSESKAGNNIRFNFNNSDVRRITNDATWYTEDERQRVIDIILDRMRKYQYLFE